MSKAYPIGTKVKFIHKTLDTNKIGTIVGLRYDGRPIVFLPTAKKHLEENRYPMLDNGTKFTWKCSWDEIELMGQQQLLFDFMYV